MTQKISTDSTQDKNDGAIESETIFTRGDDMQDCIDNCTDCFEVCEQMVQHCLRKGGMHASADHIGLLIDCADTCRSSVVFMLRDSPFHHLTCGTCAVVCTACAESCESMNDDELMQECIEICRRCADSCSKMASMQ